MDSKTAKLGGSTTRLAASLRDRAIRPSHATSLSLIRKSTHRRGAVMTDLLAHIRLKPTKSGRVMGIVPKMIGFKESLY